MMNETVAAPATLRADLQRIADWIPAGSRVLDLGCGNGQLLSLLELEKSVSGYGIELEPQKVATCIENGVNVIQTDLNEGLTYFDSDSFDFVVLSLTLQAMHKPRELLDEMLRVGRNGIVTFPNFAYWRNRAQIALTGKMPVSKELPFKWYNTPNIHLCTIRDFALLCDELGFSIDQSVALRGDGSISGLLTWLPNLFGEISMHRFSKKSP